MSNRAKGKGKKPESHSSGMEFGVRTRLRASVEQREMCGAVSGMNVGGISEMNDITSDLVGTPSEISERTETASMIESNYDVINILPEVQFISDEVIFLCKKKQLFNRY